MSAYFLQEIASRLMSEYDKAVLQLQVQTFIPPSVSLLIDMQGKTVDDSSSKECVNLLSIICILLNFKARHHTHHCLID